MKKLLLVAVVAISMSSCFNTRILVGNVTPNEPVVEVNRVWNHHLLYGLIPLKNASMEQKEYLPNRENYVVKTNLNFLNQLVSCLTFGIYTPSNTVYYIPLKDLEKK